MSNGLLRIIMNQLCHVIYVSSSKGIMSEEDLFNLLKYSRAENTKHNITGMLLYHDGNIMQVIEGQRHDIDQLLNNIKSDSRHKGIIILIDEPIESRFFSEWSMSYKKISGNKIVGFSDFFSSGWYAEDNTLLAGEAIKLLLSFRG